MSLPKMIRGLEDVAHLYEGVILDLWGVVHNGQVAFPEAVPTLKELKRSKRPVWLLSNAPRRAFIVKDQLTAMGVTPDLYEGIMTSGEATWILLHEQYIARYGKNVYHLGALKDESLYEGLDVNVVDDPAKADFVLVTGVTDFSHGVEHYVPLLEKFAENNLPMICANPDRIVHVGDDLVICAGSLAEEYESMDQTVSYIGKPHRKVYSLCLEKMGRTRILAIGDAMVTDIAGAYGAGLDSGLVVSGIHRNQAEALEQESGIIQFLEKYPYRPNYLLKKLSWA